MAFKRLNLFFWEYISTCIVLFILIFQSCTFFYHFSRIFCVDNVRGIWLIHCCYTLFNQVIFVFRKVFAKLPRWFRTTLLHGHIHPFLIPVILHEFFSRLLVLMIWIDLSLTQSVLITAVRSLAFLGWFILLISISVLYVYIFIYCYLWHVEFVAFVVIQLFIVVFFLLLITHLTSFIRCASPGKGVASSMEILFLFAFILVRSLGLPLLSHFSNLNYLLEGFFWIIFQNLNLSWIQKTLLSGRIFSRMRVRSSVSDELRILTLFINLLNFQWSCFFTVNLVGWRALR
jgi:hypothetical protein